MPAWIVVALIGTVCAAAFIGAVVGTLVIRHRQAQDANRHVRATMHDDKAEKVVASLRDLIISISALDDDLRGRHHA
jgi:F0F1-type ATP synthase assembly protein I